VCQAESLEDVSKKHVVAFSSSAELALRSESRHRIRALEPAAETRELASDLAWR
jgi:hypothetical protein